MLPEDGMNEGSESFREFLGKSAVALLLTGTLVLSPATFAPGTLGAWYGFCARSDGPGARRLGRIGAQKPVFQRRAIEAADNGLHFFGVRSVDESEALRLLCFGVADDFD